MYAQKARRQACRVLAKRGPKTAWTDTVLTEEIRTMLAGSPFLGEGHRKTWARLRLAGTRTSKARVLRLMREARVLAPTRVGRAHGPKAHDGTITTKHPNQMWGTDATTCCTTQEGTATVFIAVDHCSTPSIGARMSLAGAPGLKRSSRCDKGCGSTWEAMAPTSPWDWWSAMTMGVRT